MLNWLDNRLTYLDIYFGNALSINAIKKSNTFSVYPSLVKDVICIKSLGELDDKNYKISN
ncbi:MAG: hypothetical protein HRT67_12830 [Flavobacteriaceae bacterium]|nr:hypothetical protein [Flavobacteriaceae bacterium]